MDFENLRTFLEVSRLKSFSKAAQKLLRTQPAVSAQIRSLEQEVGARLFDRDGGKVTFTPAGRLFEPFAEYCVERQKNILMAIAEQERAAGGGLAGCGSGPRCRCCCPRTDAAGSSSTSCSA